MWDVYFSINGELFVKFFVNGNHYECEPKKYSRWLSR